MKINNGEHPLIKQRQHRVSLNKRDIMNKAVDDMLEAEIIETSHCPWLF